MSKKPLQLTELELREALRLHLSQTNDSTALMFEEWNIESGQSRIDMAVVTTTSLLGYEIKSDFDSTHRLFNQIHAYNRTFDHIYIVTGPESAKMLDGYLPSWWGILHGERLEDGTVHLSELRQPQTHSNRDPFSLLQLLKREELNSLAVNQQLPKKVIKGGKFNLLDSLANSTPLEVIAGYVTQQIRTRSHLSVA